MAILVGDAELEADEIEPEADGDGTVQPQGIDEVRGPAANKAPDRRLSEWEAESDALSEAVAMIEGEPEGAGESGVGGAEQSSATEESGSAASGIDDAASDETSERAKEEPEPEHRRLGFLRRIRGG
jgi:hypothetical protein